VKEKSIYIQTKVNIFTLYCYELPIMLDTIKENQEDIPEDKSQARIIIGLKNSTQYCYEN
jgi:hypothetical protein